MATRNFTHPDRKPSESVGGLSAPIPDTQRPLRICIRPMRLNFWEYEGSRAQIEAENVIPPGIEWPRGAQNLYFTVGRFRYWLCRTRPDGVKGPMSIWTNGDWWRLRCDLIDGPSIASRRILEKERELADAIYRQSPAGQREWEAQWIRRQKADQDKAFQAFKAIFLPQRKKPSRKPRSEAIREAQTGVGGANA